MKRDAAEAVSTTTTLRQPVAPLEQPSVKSLPSIALGWHPLNQVCLQVYRRQLVGWRLLLSPVDEQGQDCALYAFCVQMLLKVCIENKVEEVFWEG
jgi:hypothetical protein